MTNNGKNVAFGRMNGSKWPYSHMAQNLLSITVAGCAGTTAVWSVIKFDNWSSFK